MRTENFYDRNPQGAVMGFWGTHVHTQGKSPWKDGVLQIRPNGLHYTRWREKHQVMYGYKVTIWNGRFSGYQVEKPDDAPVTEHTLSEHHMRLRIAAGNKFHEEVGALRVNLYDLYRTRIESANMVVKTANKLVHAYRLLKKGKWRQFCRTLGITAKRPSKAKHQNIPALWLEYSYGWSPLIGDLYTMLDQPFEAPSAFVRKVVREQVPYSGEKNQTFSRMRLSGTIKCRGVAAGLVMVDAPAMHALAQYGITNPTAVAWEAVPFSFVVDWFAPIGDFLQSLGALNGLKFKDYSVTTTIESELNATSSIRIDRWDSWSDSGSGNSTFHYKSKVRAVMDGPEWIYPGNTGPLSQSLTRFSYALSLLASVFGSKRK